VSEDEQYIEIWGDRVSMRDLVIALAACAATTVVAVVIGRALGSSEFFWGLGGSVVGFGAAVALVRPKRDVQIVADDAAEPAEAARPAGAHPAA